MGPLNFLKQKVSQGLSDVENWGADAGNDITNAVHSVFGTTPGQTNATPSPTVSQAPQNLSLSGFANTRQQEANNPPPIVNPTAPTLSLINGFKPAPPPPPPKAPVPGHPSDISQIGTFLGGLYKSTVGQLGNTDPLAGSSLINNGGPSDSQLLAQEAKSAQQNAQGLGATPYRIVGSINNRPITPSGLGIALAGNKPVPTYQQIAKQSGGLTAGLQASMDALMAAGAVKGGGDLAVRGAKALDTANKSIAINSGLAPEAGFAKIPGKGANEPTPISEGAVGKNVEALPIKNTPIEPTKITQDTRTTDQVSLDKTQPDVRPIDNVMANASGRTPQDESIIRINNQNSAQRSIAGEQAALDANNQGGTLEEATNAYKQVTGASDKMAAYRTKIALRQAQKALRVNPRAANPEEGLHPLPVAEAGDYERAPINKGIVDSVADSLGKKVNDSLTALSDKDRSNFEDYLEGTKDVSKADSPDLVKQAIADGTKLTDTGNALDHEVGGQTPHIDKYFPGYVDHTDPVVMARDRLQAEQDLEEEVGPKQWNKMSSEEKELAVNNRMGESQANGFREDENYSGFRNQKREFATRADRVKAGVKDLYEDPRDAYQRYVAGLKFKVGNRAFIKAAREADINTTGSLDNTINLGGGQKVDVGDAGAKALKGEDINANKGNPLTKVNRAVKKSLISLGVPHALIIPQRAAGALAEIKASTALRSSIEAVGSEAADLTKLNKAKPIKSDIVEFGSRIDSPIRGKGINAGVDSVSKGAKYNPLTMPKRVVYDWLLPKIHSTLLTALKENLDARNISYDSAEARSMGHQINDVMGYAKTKGGLFNESTFAPALIKSTARMYAKSLTPSGSIARGGVAGQELFNQAVGFISKSVSNQISQSQGKPQNKSKDDFWSTVLKELYKPSAYTPFHKTAVDTKTGKTFDQGQIDLNIPGQYQADALRIFSNLSRGNNGQLGVHLNNPSQIASNTAQTAEDIASPIAGAALNATTNHAYNGTQIRNPYAPLTTQIAQTAVNSVSNALPINLQGLINPQIKSHLPQSVQSAINLSQTGPTALRVAGNTLGLNPSVDPTTGSGPATQRFYQGITNGQDYIAAKSANISQQNQSMGVFNQFFSGQKNDAGQTILKNEGQNVANWGEIASNPIALQGVQKAYQAEGKGNYDPEWNLSQSQLQTYARYKSLPPGDPEKDVLMQQNPFILQTIQASQDWANKQIFNSTAVPGPGYVPYPTLTTNQNNLMAEATKLAQIPAADKTADQISQLNTIENDPNLKSAYQALDQYTNAQRASMNLTPINYIPDAPPAVSNWSNTYETADAATRATMKSQNPGMYTAMNQAYENSDLGSLEKQASIAYLSGKPSDSLLSAIYNLGSYDVNKTVNANGTNTYSLTNFSSAVPLSSSSLPVENAVNGKAPGSSTGGSAEKPLVALPPRLKGKRIKLAKAPRKRNVRAKLARSNRKINITPTQTLKSVAVARPTQVLRIKA